MTATYDPTAQFDIDVSEEIYRSRPDGDWPVRLYFPQGDGPFAILLDVHGGASSNGSYLNNEDVDRALAASSILVAAIEFRQAPEHVYPEQVADVKYGTRWLKARAADLGGEPSGDATVRYAIKGWPMLDLHARYFYARDAGVECLMKSPENYFSDEDTMREGNPQLVLERGEQTVLPPALILQARKTITSRWRYLNGSLRLINPSAGPANACCSPICRMPSPANRGRKPTGQAS